MKKENVKSFVLGMFMTLVVISMINPLSAAVNKMISVSPGVNIYMDDVKLNPTDVNGNPVEVFIYNGTTYMPVRAVSEAIGKAVSWDGATQSVYLGKHESDTPITSLDKLEYFNSNSTGLIITDDVTDVYGTVYTDADAFRLDGQRKRWWDFAINGMYSRYTGKILLQESRKGSTDDFYFKVYGDGKLLYTSPAVNGSTPIEEFDIDISNVLTLRIEEYSPDNYFYSDAWFVIGNELYQ